jgi:hypothetical protein
MVRTPVEWCITLHETLALIPIFSSIGLAAAARRMFAGGADLLAASPHGVRHEHRPSRAAQVATKLRARHAAN